MIEKKPHAIDSEDTRPRRGAVRTGSPAENREFVTKSLIATVTLPLRFPISERLLMTSHSDIYRRALSLLAMYRPGDEPAIAMTLCEVTDPVIAGQMICALVKIIATLDSERPDNLDAWIQATLLNIALNSEE